MRERIVFAINGVGTTSYLHGKQNKLNLYSYHTQKFLLQAELYSHPTQQNPCAEALTLSKRSNITVWR